MDLASLSETELLRLMIFFGAGGLIFALIFVTTFIIAVRRRAGKSKQRKTSVKTTRPPVQTKEKTMGLLKSTERKVTTVNETQKDDRIELLSVWVNPQTKEVSVKVNHRRYDALTDVTEKRVGKRILEGAAALLAFTRGIIATADGTKSLPIPTLSFSEIQMPQQTAINTPIEKVADNESTVDAVARQRFLDELEAQTQELNQSVSAPVPEKKSRWGLGRKKKEPEAPQSLLEPFNLVEQIDEILQQKLLAAGETRRIGIQSVPSGGMRIHVGNEIYNSLDEVADTDIKAIIQSAIKAWEAR